MSALPSRSSLGDLSVTNNEPPRLPRVLLRCFSEKQPFRHHAAVPAMVKRESLELGVRRNWLLTRLAFHRLALRKCIRRANGTTPPRAFMPDARLQAPAWTMGSLGGERRAAPLQRSIPALTTTALPLQLEGVCTTAGRVRRRQLGGDGAESNGQFHR